MALIEFSSGTNHEPAFFRREGGARFGRCIAFFRRDGGARFGRCITFRVVGRPRLAPSTDHEPPLFRHDGAARFGRCVTFRVVGRGRLAPCITFRVVGRPFRFKMILGSIF